MFLYTSRGRFFTGSVDAGSSLWLILSCKELVEVEVEGSRLSAAAKEISMD